MLVDSMVVMWVELMVETKGDVMVVLSDDLTVDGLVVAKAVVSVAPWVVHWVDLLVDEMDDL